MNKTVIVLISYYLIINFVAVIMTVSDKSRAKRNKWRISESSLMIVGLLGGAFLMYPTMKIIHHKTLHKKFMIGLPIEIIFHIIILAYFVYVILVHNLPHF